MSMKRNGGNSLEENILLGDDGDARGQCSIGMNDDVIKRIFSSGDKE